MCPSDPLLLWAFASSVSRSWEESAKRRTTTTTLCYRNATEYYHTRWLSCDLSQSHSSQTDRDSWSKKTRKKIEGNNRRWSEEAKTSSSATIDLLSSSRLWVGKERDSIVSSSSSVRIRSETWNKHRSWLSSLLDSSSTVHHEDDDDAKEDFSKYSAVSQLFCDHHSLPAISVSRNSLTASVTQSIICIQ